MNDDFQDSNQDFKELSVLKKQLIISLKFHHSDTLKKVPLDVALQAMMEVWESCHIRSSKKKF
ncbi:hypothetical protein GS597_18455 [Synechococcales cyanobacterium C]|uniref:Uncharacterized protein n=2 Tax=Petrachloros TaxID=2918834 RepID=A0A8K2A8V1_9CYAN|nr:hypothetical protein [Petrachloros mirabilis ULC683]